MLYEIRSIALGLVVLFTFANCAKVDGGGNEYGNPVLKTDDGYDGGIEPDHYRLKLSLEADDSDLFSQEVSLCVVGVTTISAEFGSERHEIEATELSMSWDEIYNSLPEIAFLQSRTIEGVLLHFEDACGSGASVSTVHGSVSYALEAVYKVKPLTLTPGSNEIKLHGVFFRSSVSGNADESGSDEPSTSSGSAGETQGSRTRGR